MCGIIGITAKEGFSSQELLSRLKRLEYRGYDSYGYWNGSSLTRHVGKIHVQDDAAASTCAIAHTRWATNGAVTMANAHPHRAGTVTIAHNGIIENWAALKQQLEGQGATFSSETDSELIAHYVNSALEKRALPSILQSLCTELKGTFAILLMVDGDPNLYALKRDSPLALGICDDRMILGSDIYAFCDVTDRAIFFENDEFAIITPTTYEFHNSEGKIEKEVKQFDWKPLEKDLKEYPHFMIKEIEEEPAMCERLLTSLEHEQETIFQKLISEIEQAESVVFTGCGTAYHAALLGASFLHRQGVKAQAIIASEFENFITINPQTLVIAVSQSGETMDVIEALKYSQKCGATIGSIVNVPYSTIERMSSLSLQILAGQEVAVASTKAFTNQCTLLLAIAAAFDYKTDLAQLPKKIARVLEMKEQLKKLAFELHRHRDLYILGRNLGYPMAREIALKIKEVSYIHAEGMMGGELKHGTIALIEQGTPVLSLIYDGDAKMETNTEEVSARGARTIRLGTKKCDIPLPATDDAEFAILSGTAGQLLAYYIAKERDLPIDKPRNLAKSVTVL